MIAASEIWMPSKSSFIWGNLAEISLFIGANAAASVRRASCFIRSISTERILMPSPSAKFLSPAPAGVSRCPKAYETANATIIKQRRTTFFFIVFISIVQIYSNLLGNVSGDRRYFIRLYPTNQQKLMATKICRCQNSLSFPDHNYLISIDTCDLLCFPVTPADFDRLDLFLAGEPKMKPKVILRQIATTRLHFLDH